MSDEPGRELAVPSPEFLDAGPIDPELIERRLLGSPEAVTIERVNRLGKLVRSLGLTSIGLAVGSATFVWPAVRLRGLVPVIMLSIASGLAGLLIRKAHRRLLRRLPHDPRRHQLLLRSKVHRCHVGLALAGLMLTSGVAIRLAEMARRSGDDASDAIRPDVATGFARLRTTARPPGSAAVEGSLSVAVASAELQRSEGASPTLVVRLEARNLSDGRKIDLDAGRDIAGPLTRCSLHDNLGNRYTSGRLELGPRALDRGSLYPGETVSAEVSFDQPVPEARTLLLYIPAGSYRLDEAVTFEIDAEGLHSPESGE